MILVSLEHTAKLWIMDCVRITERIIVVNESRQNSNRTVGTSSADDVGLLAPPVNAASSASQDIFTRARALSDGLFRSSFEANQLWNRLTSRMATTSAFEGAP